MSIKNILNSLFNVKDQETSDMLGAYPEKVHVRAMPERRYLLTSRFLVITSIVAMCINVMLACTLFMMIPQKSSRPRLTWMDKRFNSVALVERHFVRKRASTILNEMLIAEYVNLRHTILTDIDEMQRRWGENSKLFWYSKQDNYSRFKNMTESNPDFGLTGIPRSVEILWINERAPGLWVAEFNTYDYDPKLTEPLVRKWRALLRVAYMNINFPNKKERMKNPFGFIVTNYSLSYRGIVGEKPPPLKSGLQKKQNEEEAK